MTQAPSIRKLIVTLPLPNRVLLPNRSRSAHWGQKARATEKARRDAGYAAMHAMNEQGRFFSKRPLINVVWHSKTKTRPDRDAVISSLKPTCDGFADAGLFDNDRDLRIGDVEFAVDKADPRLEIEIEEIK